jgi:hypothetical protein
MKFKNYSIMSYGLTFGTFYLTGSVFISGMTHSNIVLVGISTGLGNAVDVLYFRSPAVFIINILEMYYDWQEQHFQPNQSENCEHFKNFDENKNFLYKADNYLAIKIYNTRRFAMVH